MEADHFFTERYGLKIQKEMLRLRHATPKDASILCKWWNDGKVMEHAGFPNGLSIEEEKVSKQIAQDDNRNRRLIVEFDDVPIGEMNYRETETHTAEIGIKICEENWQNKGLGTCYLRMLIDYLFTKMGYKKLVLDTNLKNKRAQHVYEKLGFQKKGIRADSWKDQLGNLQSSVDYELRADTYCQDC